MRPRCILAIDQGTTNTKALLIDETGAVVARASEPVEVRFPQPGWVEEDPLELWRTVQDAAAACLAAAGPRIDIAAIAVTNQRESAIAWDRASGRPLGPCIVWQCRRTAAACADLRHRRMGDRIAGKTGLQIDPLFSATKFRWLIDHADDGPRRAAHGEICVGTVDSWLAWSLTAGVVHACDLTNASRTQLLNLRSCQWDDELIDLFGVPKAVLPGVKPSSGVFGRTASGTAIPAGLPIASLVGDSHAALFGHLTFGRGSVKATYGTGSSLMSAIGAPTASRAGLSTTIAWALHDGTRYALEGNITSTGGAVDWLSRFLGPDHTPASVARLADAVPDSDGVYLVPAFAGLGAPHWDDGARGLMCGLTRGTTAAHVARATLEAIAFQVRDVFDAMQQDAGLEFPALLADGGASGNDTLMQIQADTIGRPVIRSRSTDLSACGAAYLAGLATGVWASTDALAKLPHPVDRFEPRMADAERARRYDGWRDAVARARSRS